ncbi:hypothetical protein [Chitinivorax sp. B]|uniref:hypothetical protein n=1 Tax=Chitinivorax sp. B TaxID=2502235 RepID=UPI0010F70615|nr:hypothetical protein [Chitinivorax sp. B]
MKMSLQFHATSEELISLLEGILNQNGLYFAIMRFRPFSMRILSKLDDAEKKGLEDLGRVEKFNCVISPNEILLADTEDKFQEINSGYTTLEIGKRTDDSLGESGLTFMSDDEDGKKVAKMLANKVRKITKGGIWAVNPTSLAEAYMKNSRYSDGAKILYKNGLKILPFAGNAILEIRD